MFPATELHDHGCRRLIPLPSDWIVTAEFGGAHSEYRYSLTHIWDAAKPLILFGMMNPSGADIHYGDTTVLRTAGFAERWGYGGQIIVNACAYRARNPAELLRVIDPIGPDNRAAIEAAACRAKVLVVAHGQLPKLLKHTGQMMFSALARTGKPLLAFGFGADGRTPLHPLARGKNAITRDSKPIMMPYHG